MKMETDNLTDELICVIDNAPNNRSKCRHCRQAITKGNIRIRLPGFYKRKITNHFFHPDCLGRFSLVGLAVEMSSLNDSDREEFESTLTSLPSSLLPSNLEEGSKSFVGKFSGLISQTPVLKTFRKEFGETGRVCRATVTDGMTSTALVGWDDASEKILELEQDKGYSFTNLTVVERTGNKLELHITDWTEIVSEETGEIQSLKTPRSTTMPSGVISRSTKTITCASCHRRLDRGTFRILWAASPEDRSRPHHLGCIDPNFLLKTYEDVLKMKALPINDLTDLKRRISRVLDARAPEMLETFEAINN